MMIHDDTDEEYEGWQDLPDHEDYIRNEDWDALLIFDGCRWDALKWLLDQKGEYEVEKLKTPTTSGTTEWTDIVWRGDWGDVTYLSGNPQSRNVRNYDQYGIKLENHVGNFINCTESSIFGGGCWDFHLNTSRPEEISRRAIEEEPPVVVHYLQPHVPFVGKLSLSRPPGPYITDLPEEADSVIEAYGLVEEGLIDEEVLRAAYIENLHYAWRESSHVRNEFDTVIASADHGTALKEGYWGHGGSTPQNRIVPWAEV